MKIGKYLTAVQQPDHPRRKTHVWDILSSTQGSRLGEVAWFPRWRQYVFDPRAGTTYNYQCLLDIAGFLLACNRKHREGGA